MWELLRFLEVLFIIDDIIANKSLDKKRHPLLELSISGRHWVIIYGGWQSCSDIPKNLRRQAKDVFVWYPKDRADLKAIHDGNDVLTDNWFVIVRGFLRKSKHVCLYIQNEYPCGFRLLNHAWGDYFKWTKKIHLNLYVRCYEDGWYGDVSKMNHECVLIERYIYCGFFLKKERFSHLQMEQDTWEQDNFDDCHYNIMVLVKRQNELP